MSIDLSLDRLRLLVDHLPTYTRPTCHIAGTNGKGSVAALLTSILGASNPPLNVGRYNSPHLTSIYDCIVINGQPVSPDVYASARNEVERADREHNTKLSSFELLTLTALFIFERANLDIVVVEVGMGGRLDATNIISDAAILISALTAVDLDHQAFLGNTVAEIAREKAGIARIHRPFVLGPQKHGDVEKVVKDVLKGEIIPALRVETREWDEPIDGRKPSIFSLTSSPLELPAPQPISVSMPCFDGPMHALLPLYGEHQLDNLGTALAVISTLLTHQASAHLSLKTRITPTTVSHGIKSTRWPGRLSFHSLTLPSSPRPVVVLADGAHNPASSTTLSSYVTHLLSLLSPASGSAARKVSITFILSLSHSPPKTPLQTLSPFLPPRLPHSDPNMNLEVNVALLRFSPPEGMPWVKAVPPTELRDVVHQLVPLADVWIGEDNTEGQLKKALEWAAAGSKNEREAEKFIVLAGSLYLVADFYRLLGVGADAIV